MIGKQSAVKLNLFKTRFIIQPPHTPIHQFSVFCKKITVMTITSLDARIISTPDILGGKPRIAGCRISVRDVVMWYEYLGRSADEIAEEYSLELADVFAALAFYHANREALRTAWEKEEKWIEAFQNNIPSKLKLKLAGGQG